MSGFSDSARERLDFLLQRLHLEEGICLCFESVECIDKLFSWIEKTEACHPLRQEFVEFLTQSERVKKRWSRFY
jgi:hypothetical protein